MQTKLVIASLAAITDYGLATSQETTQTNSFDSASALISMYDACKVEITQLSMNYRDFDGTQYTDFRFNLVNHEDCPDMLVTVWMETPIDSSGLVVYDENEFSRVLNPEQLADAKSEEGFSI